MLALVIPIGIILVTVIADELVARYPNRALWGTLVALWLVSFVLLSPIFSSVPYCRRKSVARSTRTVSLDEGLHRSNGHQLRDVRWLRNLPPYLGGSLFYNVYSPKVYTANGREVENVEALDKRLRRHQAGAQSLSRVPCTVNAPSDAPFETLQLTFSVRCRGATQLAIPISYNGYSKVFVQRAGGKLIQIPYFHRRTDPRIIINVTSSRRDVVVHLPTLWGTLF